jgi:hypothetical protein
MRSVLRVLVAVTSFLTVSSPAFAGLSTPHPTHPSPAVADHSPAGDLAYVEHLLYGVSLWRFIATTAWGDRWFDWSNDGCSAPLVGSTGRSFDFRAACIRHDFGYRNLQLLERRYGGDGRFWTHTSRRRVDDQLYADMRTHCRSRPWWDEPPCFTWAATFYVAVRVAGGP